MGIYTHLHCLYDYNISSMEYKCQNCNRVCKSKGGLTTHQKVCKPKPDAQQAVEVKAAALQADIKPPTPVPKMDLPEVKLEDFLPPNANERDLKVAKLKTLFTRFENLLYGEGTVAEKAREDIISLMIIRLLQPQFESGAIDIMDIGKHSYCRVITTDNIRYALIRNLAELPKESITTELGKIWRFVFAVHPTTRQLFKADRYLSVRSDLLLAAIVRDLAAFDFESCPPDCIADVYQHFIHKQFKGEKSSRLGQHFTPPKVINYIVDSLEDYIKPDGILADPFMGTGGFLLSAYQKMKKLTDRDPATYIYGSEIDADVHRYAVANMLINTGKVCDKLMLANAFDPKPQKYDMIFTNPPFGGSVPKDMQTSWFAPTKTSSRNLLCLQYNMHMLTAGGICSMVWPLGNELNSTRKAELEIRTRLIETFEITKIVVLPKGVFEYTSIGTAVITFRKPNPGEGWDKKIDFYEYDEKAMGCEKHLITVEYDQIKAKKYSMIPGDYKDRVIQVAAEGFEIKKLGDVCEITFGTRILRDDTKEKQFPVYGGGDISFHTDQYNRDGDNLIVSRFGVSESCVRVVQGKFYLNDSGMSIKTKDPLVLQGFINHYLRSHQLDIYDLAKGTAQKNMDMDAFRNLEIPIPSPERQKEIVETIDRLEKQKEALKASIDGMKFQMELLAKRRFKFPEDVETKKLGDICSLEIGGTPSRSNAIYWGGNNVWVSISEMDGNVITDSKEKITDEGVKNSSVKLQPAGTVLMSFKLSIGKMAIAGVDLYTNEAIVGIKPKDTSVILSKYIYYYLFNNNPSDMSRGMIGNGNLNKESLSNIEIPTPDAGNQQKIVAEFTALDAQIGELTKMLNECTLFIKVTFDSYFQ